MEIDSLNTFIVKTFLKDKTEQIEFEKNQEFKINTYISWVNEIFKEAMKRLDPDFEELYKEKNEYIQRNCEKYYKNILDFNKIEEEKKENLNFLSFQRKVFKIIPISDSTEDINGIKENLMSYNKCIKVSNEKTRLIKSIFNEKISNFHNNLNNSFNLCRSKEGEQNIIDCYGESFAKHVHEIAESEYFIRYSIRFLIDEYKNDQSGFKKSSLSTAYRLSMRELNEDVFKKYI